MNIKIFCPCSCFHPDRAKDLSAPPVYSLPIFEQNLEISGFVEILPVGTELFHAEGTDG